MVAEDSVKPRIGLVAASDLNRHLLAGLVSEAGYELTVSLDAARLAEKFGAGQSQTLDDQVDAWLLDLEEQQIQQVLDLLVDHSQVPLLVNDEIPPQQQAGAHQYWKRRLIEKLELVAVPTDKSGPATAGLGAQVSVWLLAASFGGPEAVRQFLNELPADLPLAMVYGQHIDKSFDQFLSSALNASGNYPAELIRGRYHLQRGKIGIVPADRQVRFMARGEAVETRRIWAGPYQPALDQVIAEMARVYRQNLGVIVFSGMCNDGEIGCRVAKACGSKVWVQTPDSCLSHDMPRAALKTGSVSFQGTPVELARELAATLQDTENLPGGPEIPTLGASQA